jgi:membrane-associated phospholipid phosphatase
MTPALAFMSSSLPATLAAAGPPGTAGTPPDGLDQRWLRDVNGFARHTPWLHAAMSGYATYGVVVFAALLLAGWQVARRSGRPALMAAAMGAPAAALAAVAAVQPIAAHVAEARPYASMSGLLVLAHRSGGFSFPSGHAAMAGAAAAGLFLVSRRLGLIAAAAALLLAFAGVYTGAHYPDDVTAGLILGMTVTLAGYALLEGPLTRLAAYLLRTRLRPLPAAAPADPPARRTGGGPAGPGAAGGSGRARQAAAPPAARPAGAGQAGR